MVDRDVARRALLSRHEGLSARGIVRVGRSDPEGVGINTREHREGYGRDQTGSFVQFLRIAQGSTRELETHVILSGRVGLLQSNVVAGLLDDCERVSKMLRSMIRSLESRD